MKEIKVYSDYEIKERLNHGPCFGCERCFEFAINPIPKDQIDSYQKRKLEQKIAVNYGH